MADLARLQAAVEAGDRSIAVEITQAAIVEGIPPLDILEPTTEAMAVTSNRFSRQEIFVHDRGDGDLSGVIHPETLALAS